MWVFFLAASPVPAFIQAFPRSHLSKPQNRSENCVLNSLTELDQGQMIIGLLRTSHVKTRVFCDLIVLISLEVKEGNLYSLCICISARFLIVSDSILRQSREINLQLGGFIAD